MGEKQVWGTGMSSPESEKEIMDYLLREAQFEPGTEQFGVAAQAIRELPSEFFQGLGSTGRLKGG